MSGSNEQHCDVCCLLLPILITVVRIEMIKHSIVAVRFECITTLELGCWITPGRDTTQPSLPMDKQVPENHTPSWDMGPTKV